MLVAFGVAVYELLAANRFVQVDSELQTRVSALRQAISEARRQEKPSSPPHFSANRPPNPPPAAPGELSFGPPPHRPPPMLAPPSGPPPIPGHLAESLIVFPGTAALFGSQSGFYYVIRSRDGKSIRRSQNVPAAIPELASSRSDSLPHFRIWASYRELVHCSGVGDCVIVGRSVAGDLRNFAAVAWLLPAAGALVLIIGLSVGCWIVNRAVRPIELIESTADEVRRGNLSSRVQVIDPHNELGRLSSTLNTTFARLEIAFERQKQFTSDAAHELRTPLAIMISEAQASLARPRNAAEYKEALEECLDTAQQMRELTGALLDLARLDVDESNAQRTEIDLADVALDCIDYLQPLAASRGITLRHDLACARVVNVADRMIVVLRNLISNAIVYNRVHGDVCVRTWKTSISAAISVTDTGIGIAPGDLPHIFDRFYRADKVRSREGGHAGLGLSICKAILDAEGGTVEVKSEIGRGTMFIVRLPASSFC